MRKRVKMILVTIKRKRSRRRVTLHKLPSVQASVKAVIEEVVSERKRDLKTAIIDGITSGPRNAHNYLRMCAEYTDGKPTTDINLNTRFKEDEVMDAQRSLTRKMDKLFERVMTIADETIDVTPKTHTDTDLAFATRAK